MWKNLSWALLLACFVTGLTVWTKNFDIAAVVLSFYLSIALFRRFEGLEQKKWLFPAGLLLSTIIGGLYYGTEFLIFPHSVHRPQSFDDAYFGASLWVFGGMFLAAYLSEKQLEHLYN